MVKRRYNKLFKNKVNGDPIPESNIGNKMLKSMGWQPGQGLGASKSSMAIKEPIVAIKRPNRLGLGYSDDRYDQHH